MKRLYIPNLRQWLPLLLLVMAMPAKAQLFSWSESFKLSGQVVSADSLQPLQDVNVLNLNLKTGTTTDYEGRFHLQVSHHDTLVFSIIGYQRDTLVIESNAYEENHFIRILLKPRFYELKQAVFYGKDNPQVFRQKFITLEIPDTANDTITQIPGVSKGVIVQNPAGGVAIDGPFSVLYNRLSKHAQELRKLESLQSEDERQRQIAAKYNREYVAQLTGLEGMQLTAFMDFCNVQDEFVLASQQLDIMNRVVNCYKEYRQQQK